MGSRPLEIQPLPSTYPVLHLSYQRIQNVASINSSSICVNSYDRWTRRSSSWSPWSSRSQSRSSSCNTWSESGSHSAGGWSHQCVTCDPCSPCSCCAQCSCSSCCSLCSTCAQQL